MWTALLLLFLGFFPQLMLDGQTFTRDIMGIVFFSTAVFLALRLIRASRTGRVGLWACRLVAVIGTLFSALLTLQLHESYRFQTRFNSKMQQIRQKMHEADDSKAVGELWCPRKKSTPNKTLQRTAATGIALPGLAVAEVAAAAELGRSAMGLCPNLKPCRRVR
jgi:hypothetical protein